MKLSSRTLRYFEGKRVLVTGGSSGIGRAIACQLAAAGASVAIMARDPVKLRATVADLEQRARGPRQRFDAVAVDVREFEPVRRAVEDLDRAAPLDCLVHSAGVAVPGYLEEQAMDVIAETLAVNLLGAIHVIKAVVPLFISRRRGHIVGVSSVAGFIGVFGYAGYCASKFGLSGFMESLRAEMKRYQVKVSLVFPPETDTPMLQKEKETQPLESRSINGASGLMRPEDVASSVLRGMAHGRFRIFPSMESRFSFWVSHWAPSGLNFYLDHLAAKARAATPSQS